MLQKCLTTTTLVDESNEQLLRWCKLCFSGWKTLLYSSSRIKCFCIDAGGKNGDVSPFLRKENEMSEELMNVADVQSVFSGISTMIYTAKNEVMMRVNTSVISLYWNIGNIMAQLSRQKFDIFIMN